MNIGLTCLPCNSFISPLQAAQKKLKSLAKQNKDRHHNYEITEAHEKPCALLLYTNTGKGESDHD